MKKVIFTFSIICIGHVLAAQNIIYEWATKMGGSATDLSRSITVDASGNVYTAGRFASADFTPGTLATAGSNDIYVSKFDASGTFIWIRQFGSTGADEARSITVDATGVYITGRFEGTVDFDPGVGVTNLVSAGSSDVFVLKLDAAGDFLWAQRMGGTGADEAYSIALDAASANVYTTGNFVGTADFSPGSADPDLVSAGLNDIFVSKLTSAGVYVWGKRMGGVTDDYALAIKLSSDGDVISAGTFSGSADLDPAGSGSGALTSLGATDTYVSKLNASGIFVWARQLGGSPLTQANSITGDASGNIYTTGYFDGTTDFDPGAGTDALASAGSRDIFISKLDATGAWVWARRLGSTGVDQARAITADASNIYLTGSYSGTVDFDPGVGVTNFTEAGAADIFIAKFTLAGIFVLARTFGDVSFDQGESIILDGTGNIHTSGFFQGTIDFNPGAGTANLVAVGIDIFQFKLSQQAVFPLTLLDFIAKLPGNQTVQLQWRTASEISTSHFDIEKSTNGTSFTSIGKILASGNSLSVKNYSFSDTRANNGSNYYRLKMMDIDGKFTYSKVVAVTMNGKQSLQLFPNPAKSILFVQATGNSSETILRITDAAGKIVKEQKVILNGSTSLSIDINSLPKGMYYLSLREASKTQQQQKFIKQ